jgi:hypothetical protein
MRTPHKHPSNLHMISLLFSASLITFYRTWVDVLRQRGDGLSKQRQFSLRYTCIA